MCVLSNTLCIGGGQVGLGVWQLKILQTVTFKQRIFLSHLLVCVTKLHELYFIIKEDKFLSPIHTNTKPHGCCVVICSFLGNSPASEF